MFGPGKIGADLDERKNSWQERRNLIQAAGRRDVSSVKCQCFSPLFNCKSPEAASFAHALQHLNIVSHHASRSYACRHGSQLNRPSLPTSCPRAMHRSHFMQPCLSGRGTLAAQRRHAFQRCVDFVVSHCP